MKRFLRNNGLTLTLALLFGASLVGQVWTGLAAENAEQALHGEALTTLLPYLGSGSFLSALFENWESEFLQMAAFEVKEAARGQALAINQQKTASGIVNIVSEETFGSMPSGPRKPART